MVDRIVGFPVGMSVEACRPSCSHFSTYGWRLNFVGAAPFTLTDISADNVSVDNWFLVGVSLIFMHEKPEWTEKRIECQAIWLLSNDIQPCTPTTYSSEGDQMCPTQGRLNQLQWGGSRSPMTRTRPPIPPPSNTTLLRCVILYSPARYKEKAAILASSILGFNDDLFVLALKLFRNCSRSIICRFRATSFSP